MSFTASANVEAEHVMAVVAIAPDIAAIIAIVTIFFLNFFPPFLEVSHPEIRAGHNIILYCPVCFRHPHQSP